MKRFFPFWRNCRSDLWRFRPLQTVCCRVHIRRTFSEQGDYRKAMPQFQADSYEKNRALFSLIQRYAEDKNATSAQISLAWLICKKPYIVPIPGTRKLGRLTENLGAANVVLTTQEIAEIDKVLIDMEMSDVFGGAKIVKK